MPKSDTSRAYTSKRPSGYALWTRITIAMKLLGWSSKLAILALWVAPELRVPSHERREAPPLD